MFFYNNLQQNIKYLEANAIIIFVGNIGPIQTAGKLQEVEQSAADEDESPVVHDSKSTLAEESGSEWRSVRTSSYSSQSAAAANDYEYDYIYFGDYTATTDTSSREAEEESVSTNALHVQSTPSASNARQSFEPDASTAALIATKTSGITEGKTGNTGERLELMALGQKIWNVGVD